MDLQRIRYRKNEAQEFRALTERLVGESGLDIDLPYESPGVQHLMKYFNVLVGILVLQIGRASCREREKVSGGAVSVTKKKR